MRNISVLKIACMNPLQNRGFKAREYFDYGVHIKSLTLIRFFTQFLINPLNIPGLKNIFCINRKIRYFQRQF
jgi:hypothetical protein